ncbi:hypothetical protein C806_01448 [Lachnospiraceae bacterium 3-1]|nr:hypothetical protein C806_01448 [Lachnospiraceae bacterium 3-1]
MADILYRYNKQVYFNITLLYNFINDAPVS